MKLEGVSEVSYTVNPFLDELIFNIDVDYYSFRRKPKNYHETIVKSIVYDEIECFYRIKVIINPTVEMLVL